MKIVELQITSVADKMEQVSGDRDQLFSLVSKAQHGRMDEQRCTLAPATPRKAHACSPDPDDFFQLLVKSQSQRLDEQRVTLNSLPGMEAFMIKDPKDGNVLKTNFDQICSMVSRAHSFRKRNPPKMSLTPGPQDSMRRSSFSPRATADSDTYNTLTTRSASFSPISDKDRMDCESFQREQDQLLCLVSQAQNGRMDEQRCSINPLSRRHMDNSQSDQDVEKFFKLIANTQNRQLDDQRATLNRLPEIKSPHSMTAQDSDQLFSMISRIQGSRIDDQRCSAPKIHLGSPAPPKKSPSQPVSPTNRPSQSGSPTKSSQRSGTFSPDSEHH
ncbi:G-protein-signaling modulator 1-like [Carassius carassius]|uniref:G-protein-signaling modulator 1-like n=1 Tax=Carassius carassius TaxID=217509 RepID=UPI00286965DB|nr:G-protein-signaling modulator 1-like [Carassius carassius]